ncbi:origin recognition complex subunit 4 [Daktulosphaira vitifoliae]|uniref:origin recognition complex subunit 4 n=1 Tax=Daktulosphaira vitifoliae TaxID=58002 RepID=UPI0021AA942F|nr:origin recognition complex subunit 4 [Daktulosphaira vitifoliae]
MGTSYRQCISDIKKSLLLNNNLHGFESEKQELLQVVKKTTEFGESDSIIILGQKGCGKSILVKSVLKLLLPSSHTLVNLDGLIHTDDNLALKSIIQQLQMENLDGACVEGSFADNIIFLLESFQAGDRSGSKSIIMVLDRFDLFCTHTNQTLLYNLFDAVQSQQNPICIIGMTSRIDVTELLEKRVKSRFSHNLIMLKPPADYNKILDRMKCLLKIERKYKIKQDICDNWNNSIEELVSDIKIKNMAKDLLKLSNSSIKLNTIIFMALSNLNLESNNNILTAVDIVDSYCTLFKKDIILINLLGLSVLEFCLMIAICHHSEIYDKEPFNFEMIYSRYCKFASRNSTLLLTKRQVVMKAFERIATIQLIIPVVIVENKNVLKEYRLYKCSLNLDKIRTASNNYYRLPPVILQWIDSNII